MGNKNSKEKSDNSKVSGKNARKGPLPEVPNSNEALSHGVRSDKTQDSDNLVSHPKDEFSVGAKVYLVLHDFDAIGHNTVSVKKNEKVELRSQVEVWSDVYVPRLEKSGWIPSNYLAPLNSMSRYPWYHKQITRSTAEWLLRNGINGSFLVRESESTAGQYSLSVRHEGKKYHYRIQSRGGRFWIHEDTQFKDLAELIHHHSLSSSGLVTTLTHPVPNESKPAIDILTDEWEIDRNSITLGEKLGCGQYGEVYKGEWFRDRTSAGIPIAVKTLKSDSASQEEFLKEAALMKRLKHENLLHLLGVCTLQKPFFIITEYMPMGNLLEHIRNYREQMTSESLLHAASQIAAGMCFLEKENLVHRDLACRNCLVGENLTIRICDFGLSRLLDEDSYTAREGTKFPIKWTAPEALNYNTFTMKSDVWSFGIVLWELATRGETPYPSIDLQEVLGLLETGYRMKRPDGCPEQVYKLMADCWDWEPDVRPDFSDITLRLENMFTTTNPGAQLEFLTTTSVEEEVQRTLEEDSTTSPISSPRTGLQPHSKTNQPLVNRMASTPDKSSVPLTPNKSNRSKSAPVDPSFVNMSKGGEKRSRGGNSCSTSSPNLPRGSPNHIHTPANSAAMPPRHIAPAKGGSPNKYNSFDQCPQRMDQPRQFFNPHHYPPYPNQQPQPRQPLIRPGQSPGGKKIRHQLPQQQLSPKQIQQLQQQQQQVLLQQQMQQIKLQQQQQQHQQQHAERQRIAQKQHQEMWLRQQQQHMSKSQQLAQSQQLAPSRQLAPCQQLAQSQHMPQSPHPSQSQNMVPSSQHLVQRMPHKHFPSHQQVQQCDVAKHRSSSECSSNSASSVRYDADRTPGNASPASTVSSGSGTELLSELKTRQSRRIKTEDSKLCADLPNNSVKASSQALLASPKNGSQNISCLPMNLPISFVATSSPQTVPSSSQIQPGASAIDQKSVLPQKPSIVGGAVRPINGTASNFCAVNPAKADLVMLDSKTGRNSPAEEDFSFTAILQRAKGNESKPVKPIPPPKPKLNLT